jgi:hypothetical protein
MPRWPAVTCSKALTLGRAVIRISARSAMSRGEAEAHELEPVTRQVSHHHRAHDADADAVSQCLP